MDCMHCRITCVERVSLVVRRRVVTPRVIVATVIGRCRCGQWRRRRNGRHFCLLQTCPILLQVAGTGRHRGIGRFAMLGRKRRLTRLLARQGMSLVPPPIAPTGRGSLGRRTTRHCCCCRSRGRGRGRGFLLEFASSSTAGARRFRLNLRRSRRSVVHNMRRTRIGRHGGRWGWLCRCGDRLQWLDGRHGRRRGQRLPTFLRRRSWGRCMGMGRRRMGVTRRSGGRRSGRNGRERFGRLSGFSQDMQPCVRCNRSSSNANANANSGRRRRSNRGDGGSTDRKSIAAARLGAGPEERLVRPVRGQALAEPSTAPGAELRRVHVAFDAEHGRPGHGGMLWGLVAAAVVVVAVAVECWAPAGGGRRGGDGWIGRESSGPADDGIRGR
jgi:hypothetical protein